MTAAVPAIADLTSRLRNRVPVHGHNGRSGAILERASLDGEAVIIKTVDPAIDVTMRLVADTVGREHDLWQRGVLDDLGPRVTHAIISAGRDRRQLVTVMRDLGNAVLGWDRRLSRTELSRVFAALAAVHHRFAGAPPAGLVDLPTRLTLLTPRRMAPLVGTHPLATAVIEGWQHFFELVADPLAAGIEAALGDPARLLASLEHGTHRRRRRAAGLEPRHRRPRRARLRHLRDRLLVTRRRHTRDRPQGWPRSMPGPGRR
jgi:hypothetical protein